MSLLRFSVPVVTAFEVGLARLLVDVVLLREAMFLLRGQLDSNGVRDLVRERALQTDDVTKRSFVPLRPEVLLGTDLDHLCADAHALGGTQDRPFYDGFGVKFARNFG